MALDWRNIDWTAFVKSNIVRGSVVTIILGAAGIAGVALSPDATNQLTTNVNTGLDAILALGTLAAGIWNLFHRSVAQPESVATIIPKKSPDQPQS